MEWHKRFVQQAGWTGELRRYLFKRTGLQFARRVLEVGCGTGAILAGLETGAAVHGLDGICCAWPRRASMLRRQI